jgi:hypothetical protein
MSARFAAGLTAAVFLACGADAGPRDVPMSSSSGSTRSHFPDTNCQSCHQLEDRGTPAGNTPGFFSVAGTVRETDGTLHPNATVIVYDRLFDVETRETGNEILRVDVDALGMFYTTEPLPALHDMNAEGHHTGENYFPAVLDNETGIVKHMYYGVNSGACNVCHHDLYRDMSPRDDVEGDPYQQLP